MTVNSIITSTSLALLITALPVSAEQTVKPNRYSGELLAKQTCLGCHGDTVLPYVQMYPNLEGQKAAYLAHQLRAFKSNERKNPYMEGIVKGLSEQDIVDVAFYYSTLTPQNLKEKADKTMGQ